MKKLAFLILLLCPVSLWSQGMRYDNFVIKPMNTGGLISVSGALITVCTSAGTGTPCTPKVANIYSDESLTTPLTGTGGAGTTNSDSGGNFGFYAAPGSYIVTVTGTGITSYTIKVVLPLVSSQVNKTIYADGVTNTTIAAALAAAPAGGTVIVPPGCSGTVAAPPATVTISQAVRLIIQCNITSSQVPNISIQASGVTIEGGGGNSPSGGSTDAPIWTNSGAGNTIIYGDGVTSFRGLVIEKMNFRDSGAHLAARTIRFRANAADISVRDVVTVGIGFDSSDGNQELVRLERVRVNNYVNRAFNFDCTGNQFCNSITFNSTYADLGTGAPGVGYDLGNGNFILQATDSDFAPTCGYRFVGGGTVNAQGTDDESGSVAGWCVTGATGNVTLIGPKTVGEVLPISITGAANVTMVNPNTTGTTGANSITLGAGATGQNFLYGASGLDKLISGVNAPSVTLQTFGSTGNGYALTCTAVPCMSISANTIVNGAALQIANINAGGSSYNIGELFNNGTFDVRSTLGGGGFSFNSNGGAGRGIFTFTNTADRIYTFPNTAGTVGFNPPTVAGTTDLGSTALPFGNLWLGTAATNNFKFQPAATSGARIITIADPLSPTTVGLPFTIASGTSTLTVNAALAAVTSQAAITTAGTGILTTDAIEWAYASAPTAGDSLCHVSAYVTAGNVNFVRTNPTAAAQSVSAIVLNWRVVR